MVLASVTFVVLMLGGHLVTKPSEYAECREMCHPHPAESMRGAINPEYQESTPAECRCRIPQSADRDNPALVSRAGAQPDGGSEVTPQTVQEVVTDKASQIVADPNARSPASAPAATKSPP
jgi:hypothetical protein